MNVKNAMTSMGKFWISHKMLFKPKVNHSWI